MAKRTEMHRLRVSPGEILLIRNKALIEGCSVSELTRKAVGAYSPIPGRKKVQCLVCNYEDDYELQEIPEDEPNYMVQSFRDKEHELDIAGAKKNITVQGIPCQKCTGCGEITTDLSILIDIEDALERLVINSLRFKRPIPKTITVEELAKKGDSQ